MLSKFNALASDAAAISIRAHEGVVSFVQVSEALRLLELGRGVIAGAYFDTRSDITELRNSIPNWRTNSNLFGLSSIVSPHNPHHHNHKMHGDLN